VWVGDAATELVDGVGQLDLRDQPPGLVDLIWEDGGGAFALTTVVRSAPLYVVPSVDWDSSDTRDNVMDWQFALHQEHPELRITHLVGPYLWTDPELTDDRKAKLTADLASYRDDHDDEIGLHIHPYCHLVELAGVPCATEPSLAGGVDPTGYAVPNWAYTEAQFADIVATSGDLFEAHGFARPTSYRAGGWTATTDILRALTSEGIVVDSSANNWARMEEWQGTGILYDWNAEAWSTIGDTSQPYWPQQGDAQAGGPDPIGLLEVPDNAILADYVTEDEMIDVFDQNWPGGPLAVPTQVSMGWHDSVNAVFRARVSRALDRFDGGLAARDSGPVVYATMTELVDVDWPE